MYGFAFELFWLHFQVPLLSLHLAQPSDQLVGRLLSYLTANEIKQRHDSQFLEYKIVGKEIVKKDF